MARHQQSASSDWGLIEESARNCQGREQNPAYFFTNLRSMQKQCVIGYQFKLGQAFWFGLVKKWGGQNVRPIHMRAALGRALNAIAWCTGHDAS